MKKAISVAAIVILLIIEMQVILHQAAPSMSENNCLLSTHKKYKLTLQFQELEWSASADMLSPISNAHYLRVRR